MRRVILLIPMLLATLVGSASARATPDPELAGLYICDGVNPDGSPYHGLVEIVKHHDAYQLVWSFESEVVALGLGIRSGSVLAVMHYSEVPGVVAYRIEEGSRLVDEWSVVGADGAVFSETLTRAPDQTRGPATPRPGKREPPQRQQRSLPARGVVVVASRF
jgi:hypothetical protein